VYNVLPLPNLCNTTIDELLNYVANYNQSKVALHTRNVGEAIISSFSMCRGELVNSEAPGHYVN